jgi:probable rRNA maturation factor
LAFHDRELSILFTDDAHMADLNRRYLGRKGPTNVLAFPMEDKADSSTDFVMLGDIVISVDTALRESHELNVPLEDRIDQLLIHGILHLAGYDHEKSHAETKRMEEEETRLMEVIGKGCAKWQGWQ